MLLHEKKARSNGFKVIAGVDEAGRGSLAGPVVAGAVIISRTDFRERIDDSKKLTPLLRQKAYREIVKKARIGVGIVNESVIDRINIYQATIIAMERALKSLGRVPDMALIDGNVKVRTSYSKKLIKFGDSKSLSIAAASIVAKVTRDKIMIRYHTKHPQYGFDRHKGYGTRNHIHQLAKHGPSPIHRRSFKVKEKI